MRPKFVIFFVVCCLAAYHPAQEALPSNLYPHNGSYARPMASQPPQVIDYANRAVGTVYDQGQRSQGTGFSQPSNDAASVGVTTSTYSLPKVRCI